MNISNKVVYFNSYSDAYNRIMLETKNGDFSIESYINASLLKVWMKEGIIFLFMQFTHKYYFTSSFITCQAPLPNTVGDFWNMAQRKNCKIIVMLTKFQEKNRVNNIFNCLTL